jgi:hypothetical protein
MTGASVSQRPTRYFVAEVKCYWCAKVAGTLEGRWPLLHGRLVFRRGTEIEDSVAKRPWFRCTHCGGPLFLDDFDVLRARSDSSEDLEEKPRRGRPRKCPQ